MPNPKLETYKNKATGTVYDYTDAAAQAALAGILNGTDIDNFSDVETALATKVDKVTGKGLSTNDYDDTEKAKVAGAFPRSEQAVLGAYNIVQNNMVNHSKNDVTFTVASDKIITLSGTSSGDITVGNDNGTIGSVKDLPLGKYKLVGCPSGGSSSTYRLVISNTAGTAWITDFGEGIEFELTSGHTWDKLYIRANSGVNLTGKVFKPMITTDLNATYDDYVAPAMTNMELTDAAKRITYADTKAYEGIASSNFINWIANRYCGMFMADFTVGDSDIATWTNIFKFAAPNLYALNDCTIFVRDRTAETLSGACSIALNVSGDLSFGYLFKANHRYSISFTITL